MQSIEKLKAFHQRVLTQDEFKTHSWFRRAWAAVWPVIYRERNRLKGACDIGLLRVELEACIRNVPELTIWMFTFARLVCQQQVSSGLGISGDYRV